MDSFAEEMNRLQLPLWRKMGSVLPIARSGCGLRSLRFHLCGIRHINPLAKLRIMPYNQANISSEVRYAKLDC